MASEDSTFDIIITGAGLSGINAAYLLQSELPNHSFTVLESHPANKAFIHFFAPSRPPVRYEQDRAFLSSRPW